jgi:RHS repeat-associated protein
MADSAYDGLGRRVVENTGKARDQYYSAKWQVLEERQANVVRVQNVFSLVYIDALVLRDRDPSGSGTLSERLYVQQDANWNVTAVVEGGGGVVERYVYDPYGEPSVLAPNWSIQTGSRVAWAYGFTGREWDSNTGLQYNRTRYYDPKTGRWLEQDPLGFDAGDVNLYRYVGNNPTNVTDPIGSAGRKPTLFRNTIPIKPPEKVKYPQYIFPIKDKKDLEKKLDERVLEKGRRCKYVVRRDGTIVVIDTSRSKHLTHVMGTDPVGDCVQAAGLFVFTGRDKVSIDLISTHYMNKLKSEEKDRAKEQAEDAWHKLYPNLTVTYKSDTKGDATK